MELEATYVAFARYNRWMNRRLYALAATLDDEERNRDLGAFFGSLHRTLAHLLLGDRAWLGRLGADPAEIRSLDRDGREIAIRSLDQVLYEDFADLRRERERTDETILRWTEGLDGARLAADVCYVNLSGAAQKHPLWWAVSHVFNHQAHHRGQATTLLRQLGRDPGVTDLIAFLRNPDAA
jgi:uncharacterized damage-inducible protein DinB